ncbi:MAG: hypothetical protein AAGF93_23835 [Cyanobacteria bacterium P01_H01_bin.105]
MSDLSNIYTNLFNQPQSLTYSLSAEAYGITSQNAGVQNPEPSLGVNLHTAIQQAYEEILLFSQEENFGELMTVAFGDNYDKSAANLFFESLSLSVNYLPEVRVIDDELLGGASGVYVQATDVVYMSQQFLATTEINMVVDVLVEEFGHSIDARINEVDATGDEGDIFSKLVQGDDVSEVLPWLRVENDQTMLFLDNQLVSAEMNNINLLPQNSYSSLLSASAAAIMALNTKSTLRNMLFTQSINNNSANNKAQANAGKKAGEALANASRFTA